MCVVILIPILISFADSLECHDYLESPLLPLVHNSNDTCKGDYCYRVEHQLGHLSIDKKERSVLMGCFNFPLAMLNLGCRRNFEGNVLCVCQTDLCNVEPSSDIVDLPIVRDCRKQWNTRDGDPPDGRTCASNYCSKGQAAQITYSCQQNSQLERFDIFTSTSWDVFPAGMCIKFQDFLETSSEMCSCTHSGNCTMSTSSSLKQIDCLTLAVLGGVRKCRGHACFMMKKPFNDPFYGCITYDERFVNNRYKTGTHQILQNILFICEQSMCNSNLDEGTILKEFNVGNPNGTFHCDCLAPPRSTNIQTNDFNLPLLLGISIPVVLVLLVVSIILGFRLYKKQWSRPLAFLCGKHANRRIGQTTSVITVVSSKTKTK